MGQQQLILLALAVVIVGGAIVVGIRAFTESSNRANHDALVQDGVRIANDLQAWKQKATFGQTSCATAAVVQDAADFTCATFARLGYAPDPADVTVYANLNGRFQLDATQATQTTITAISLLQENEITITVTGVKDTDIAGATLCQGGVDDQGAVCTATVF